MYWLLIVQSDFEKVGDSLMAVKLDLERVKEEDTYGKKKVESLSSEIVLYQTKNQQLTRDLDKAHHEVLYLLPEKFFTMHHIITPPLLLSLSYSWFSWRKWQQRHVPASLTIWIYSGLLTKKRRKVGEERMMVSGRSIRLQSKPIQSSRMVTDFFFDSGSSCLHLKSNYIPMNAS